MTWPSREWSTVGLYILPVYLWGAIVEVYNNLGLLKHVKHTAKVDYSKHVQVLMC